MTSERWRVRDATARDMAAIAGIYSHYVLNSAATFESEPPGAAEMEERWLGVLGKGLPYLVSELKGMVVGYTYASLYRPRYAYRFTVESSVYVRADCVGEGMGRILMEELISACEEKGFRQMLAVIGDSANAASIRLHERLGFRRVGVLECVGFKFERWVDTVFMQRPLG